MVEVICDVSDCKNNNEKRCTLNAIHVHVGVCVDGKTNMKHLQELWHWSPGKELVKQRQNQSEFSSSIDEDWDTEVMNQCSRCCTFSKSSIPTVMGKCVKDGKEVSVWEWELCGDFKAVGDKVDSVS
jgi:hypothetical protein